MTFDRAIDQLATNIQEVLAEERAEVLQMITERDAALATVARLEGELAESKEHARLMAHTVLAAGGRLRDARDDAATVARMREALQPARGNEHPPCCVACQAGQRAAAALSPEPAPTGGDGERCETCTLDCGYRGVGCKRTCANEAGHFGKCRCNAHGGGTGQRRAEPAGPAKEGM